MIARRSGDIVVTSSISGHQAIHWEPIYSATKHAVQSFVHGVRRQIAKHNVRIGSLAPGMVLNELWGLTDPEEIERRIAAHSGLRNDDVVDALLFMLTRPPHVAIKATEYSEGHDPAPKSAERRRQQAPTNRSGCSTMALWRLPVRSRFPELQRSRSASVCSPSDGADDQSGLLSWQAAEVGATAKTAEDNGAALPHQTTVSMPAGRSQAPKFGMTIVTTTNQRTSGRSGDGFVVLDSHRV